MSELVTGDAVVLGLRPAKVPTRALAVLIDLVLVWTLYVAVSLAVLTGISSLDPAAVAAVQVGLFLLVPVGVPIAVETLTRGRSVGKLACGLRVLREDGGPVRFRHCLVRGALGLVEIQLSVGVIACIASLVSPRGRRLGDVFAGTLVVRERVPAVRTPQPLGQPWPDGRFAALDLSRVPEPLWLAVRQYLMRADQLDAQVGAAMSQKLAADLAAWTGAPAPAGVPPPAYLAGVLAERQAREAERAFGARHRERELAGPGGAPASPTGPEPPAWQAPEAPQAPQVSRTPQAPRPAEAEDGSQRPATGFVPPG